MPLDRVAILRNAEKLLRQGKLDLAVAEYVRIVEDQPRDWNTANILGDLYVRGGQIDKAVEQFVRIADHLNAEGFASKAAALYKKVLKIKPDSEHALMQSAEIAAGQGLLADARTAFKAAAERRRSRGDKAGAEQIRIRLGSLDPADFEARLDAARARLGIGETPSALADFKAIAADLAEKGRQADAIEVIREAAGIAPDDDELRARLLAIFIASGDFDRARECATTAAQFKELSVALREKAHEEQALSALAQALRLDPGDQALKEHLARAYVARGDLHSAAQYLTAETAGTDPKLLTMMAEIRLREGQVDEGMAILQRVLDADVSRREAIALLGWSVAESAPDTGYRVVQLAAETAVAQSDWPGAAAALQEFVTRVPNHVPALMRLVEICVDGDLEATMYSAQAQLADAYIAAGSAAEARFIAEDLVAREPWERANVERFRRALVMLGEKDPDAVIADRLSGQSPFTSTDLTLSDLPFEESTAAPEQATPSVVAETPPPAAAVSATDGAGPIRLDPSPTAAEVDQVVGALGSGHAAEEHDETEIDLSVALDGDGSDDHDRAGAKGPLHGDDIDGVFEQLRTEAGKKSAIERAEAAYRDGLAHREAGRLDEAIAALRTASKAPTLRFQAASLVGRLYRQRGAVPQAIEWFERAAQAPAPSPTEGHLLLYELADSLESTGEIARALAICLELQADAGDFKDVSARIDRLAKVQTRG